MGWNEAMNRVLPSQNGKNPHVTSGYNVYRSVGTNPHVGIDFNYVGGQTGINLTHPQIYAPVTGTVRAVGGRYGIVRIQDSDDYFHDILHTETQNVHVGDHVEAGNSILGTMGGRGAMGVQHVHYQIIKDGSTVSPEEYWNTKDSARSANRPLEFDLRLTPADEFTLRGYLPDQCFLAGTLILMADGQRKAIEHVVPNDVIMSFDPNEQEGRAELVPRRVTQTFTSFTQNIIGIMNQSTIHCTGGHIFLTNGCNKVKESSFATIYSILREDRAIVTENSILIRARTGANVGTKDDKIVKIVYFDDLAGAPLAVKRCVLVRAGIPLPATMLGDGKSATPPATLAQHLEAAGVTILSNDGLCTSDGTRHAACNWPEGSTPFDTHEARNWIVEVDGEPYTPPWIRDLVEEDEHQGLRVVGALPMAGGTAAPPRPL